MLPNSLSKAWIRQYIYNLKISSTLLKMTEFLKVLSVLKFFRKILQVHGVKMQYPDLYFVNLLLIKDLD